MVALWKRLLKNPQKFFEKHTLVIFNNRFCTDKSANLAAVFQIALFLKFSLQMKKTRSSCGILSQRILTPGSVEPSSSSSVFWVFFTLSGLSSSAAASIIFLGEVLASLVSSLSLLFSEQFSTVLFGLQLAENIIYGSSRI